MHALFVHQNFPAQFGHLAARLIQRHAWRCSFLTAHPPKHGGAIEVLAYQPRHGATRQSPYLVRSFQNATAHATGVYLAARDLRAQPDVIVGHSGFGSTLFLRELFDCPIVNYFEYFYRPRDGDMDFRPEFPPTEIDRLRVYCRNAAILLDLENCDAGYSPTHFQAGLLPARYRDKLSVVFDGIDTALWRRQRMLERRILDRAVPEDVKIVTYVSRGLEAMRGFDVFMKVAKRVYERDPRVLFVVVGEERCCYGGDENYIRAKTFKEHVLAQDDYDLSKFVFAGRVPPSRLVEILSLSDLHIYLTVPFVLSWSLMNAMACGCPVLASATAPVKEVVTHRETGLLADFFDVDALADGACELLTNHDLAASLTAAARRLVETHYSLEVTFPQWLGLIERVTRGE